MLEDNNIEKKEVVFPINMSLDDYIRSLDISEKGIKVFKAYKISLNKSKNQIINILDSAYLTEDNILLNQIAYKISVELEEEMKDINYKVKNILEGVLGVKHNY